MSLLSSVGDLFTKALPWVSAGLGLLSTVKSYQSAKAVEKQGAFNADVWRAEAAANWRSYEDKAQIMRHEQRIFNETQKANYAKSGVALEGTPILVLNDIIYRQKLDETALYHEASAQDAKLKRQGAQAEWQAYNEASAIRSQALSNFGSSLLGASGRVMYGDPWTSSDDEKVKAKATKAPTKVTRPNYTRAQANAVPGGSGWRPVQAAR